MCVQTGLRGSGRPLLVRPLAEGRKGSEAFIVISSARGKRRARSCFGPLAAALTGWGTLSSPMNVEVTILTGDDRWAWVGWVVALQ